MGAKILVIDDDPVNIDLMDAVLTSQGYTVIGATSGAAGLEVAEREQPDLILLDVVMPGMDGYEVCRRLRAATPTSLIPVVIMSASKEAEKLVALEAGADDFIRMPLDRAELLGRVKSLLRLKQSYTTIIDQAARLAELNRTLEARVQDQVEELDRVSRLRRYLSPQLAELIISSGDESVLDSHRREITVVFCDLRGFTGFAEVVEPEDVMAVLREYHTAVGELIFRYEGTLERFAGDGVMVFFNDPIPCPDPPARAVQMAVTMRERVGELTKGWRKRGHELGFGVGVSVGFATLGKIGFQGRFDYAAIGNVTNLAARLCEEAQDGQILISQRVYAAVETLVEAEPVGEVSLKGFRLPVAAFNVIRLRATVPPLDASEASSAAALTPLEQKLAVLIARGMADAQIAEHLGISEKTATDHIDSIIRKLGLTGRPQVARWVVEQGVLQKPS